VRKTEIRVERVDSFFERGRKFAKSADQGNAIPYSRVVAFEDVESLLEMEPPDGDHRTGICAGRLTRPTIGWPPYLAGCRAG
jgi:hypothetical protein